MTVSKSPLAPKQISDHRKSDRAGRAFSLIELLIVIFIIAMVIAIVVPALGGANKVAKATSSRALMTDVINASVQYQQDNRRMPGLFTPEQMGDPDNATRGMSAMENALLDLSWAGAITKLPGNAGVGGARSAIYVGPLRGVRSQAQLNVDLLGVNTDSDQVYFAPDPRFMASQYSNLGQQIGDADNTGPEGSNQLPDLVDAFGNPLLLWVDNANAGPVDNNTVLFALEDTSSPNAARMYWNSNAAFLKATSLGKGGEDQTDANRGSIIGGSYQADHLKTMAALFGHPSFSSSDRTYPTAPRSAFVLQSAGSDGVYFSKKDKGFRQFGQQSSDPLEYIWSFQSPSGGIYLDSNGKAAPIDIIEGFDDLMATGG